MSSRVALRESDKPGIAGQAAGGKEAVPEVVVGGGGAVVAVAMNVVPAVHDVDVGAFFKGDGSAHGAFEAEGGGDAVGGVAEGIGFLQHVVVDGVEDEASAGIFQGIVEPASGAQDGAIHGGGGEKQMADGGGFCFAQGSESHAGTEGMRLDIHDGRGRENFSEELRK